MRHRSPAPLDHDDCDDPSDDQKYGTIGAVACDLQGNLAASAAPIRLAASPSMPTLSQSPPAGNAVTVSRNRRDFPRPNEYHIFSDDSSRPGAGLRNGVMVTQAGIWNVLQWVLSTWANNLIFMVVVWICNFRIMNVRLHNPWQPMISHL